MQDKIVSNEISKEAKEKAKKTKMADEPEDEEILSCKRTRPGIEISQVQTNKRRKLYGNKKMQEFFNSVDIRSRSPDHTKGESDTSCSHGAEGEVDFVIKESLCMSLAVLAPMLENKGVRTEDELTISANEPHSLHYASSREHNGIDNDMDIMGHNRLPTKQVIKDRKP